MKVFISWSGERSKALASAFRDWIPAVIQAVHPYFSPDDVAKGARWSNEIAKELDAASVGIICLTADNLQAPWILFEAGALAKKLDKARVCPIVFGIAPTDVKDPLAQFQAARFSKGEIKKVVKMINDSLGEEALADTVLSTVFEMWWPQLDGEVTQILSAPEADAQNIRTERDMLEEILALTRRWSGQSSGGSGVNRAAVADLARSYVRLCDICAARADPEVKRWLARMSRPIHHIASHAGGDVEKLTAALANARTTLMGVWPERVAEDRPDDSGEQEV